MSELVDGCKVDEHKIEHEDDLIDNEVLDTYVTRNGPSNSPIKD